MQRYQRSGLTFDVADAGPSDASAIVLLHGWPGGATTWDEVVPLLGRAGYRTLAVDQRGYSPGARPPGRRAYAMPELAADVVALLDAAGLARVHLVGHDWGGAVAWHLAESAPERLKSLTVISTPHPRALAQSLWRSDQILRSAYIGAFQLPLLPESLLLARNAAILRSALRRSGLAADRADAYAARQLEPGALTAALNWYRAVPLHALHALPAGPAAGQISVPTRFVWGDRDSALGGVAARSTGDHVSGPYRFERVEGGSHWLPEDQPGRVAAAIIDHVEGHA